MADMNAEIKLTADTASVDKQIAQLIAQFEKLHGSALPKAASGLHEVETASQRVRHEEAELVQEGKGLIEVFEGLSTQSKLLGGSLGAIGVGAGEATEGVARLAESFVALESAVPGLLLLAAAFAIVMGAFEFMKEGVTDAANLESQLQSLGAAVTAQGGIWEQAKEGIDAFIESETLASGYTSGQLVPALNELVTAGNSVHDSQIIMGVAEELARAKHIDLREATQLLISAEAGRAQGLVKQDINLRELVKTHGNFSELLKVLHKDMGGAIADNNTYEMQNARLKVVMDQLAETFGKMILPMLTEMAESLIGLIKETEDFGNAVVQVFNGIVQAIGHGAAALEHFAMAMVAASHGNFAGAADQWKSMQSQGEQSFKGLTSAAQGFGKAWKAVWEDDLQRGKDVVKKAVDEHKERLGDITLDKDHVLGNTPKGKKEAVDKPATGQVSVNDYQHYADVVDKYAVSQKNLDKQIKDSTLGEKALKEQVLLATTVAGQRAAQAILDGAIQNDRLKQLALLRVAENTEQSALDGLNAKKTAQIKIHDNLVDSYKRLADKKLANGGLSQAEETQLLNLDQKIKTSDKSLADLNKSITINTDNLERNRQKSVEVTDAYNAQASAADLLAAANARAWDKFTRAETESLTESYAMFEKTNAQKVVIYQQMLNELNTGDVDYEKKREELAKKENAAVLGAWEDQLKAFKKLQDDMTNRVAGFIDDVVVKHKSMKDILKTIYDEILQAFIKMVSAMIVKAILFKSVSGALGDGAGGLASSFFGASAGGGGASGHGGTAQDPAHVIMADVSSNALNKLGGAGGGGFISMLTTSSGAASLLGVGAIAGGAMAIGATVGNAYGGGSHTTNAMIGAGLGVAGLSAAFGGGILGAGGGMLGGAGTLLAAGPAGWAALAGIALIGALAGGAFGNKGPNAHDNPDQAGDVGSYASFVANMTGGDNEHFGSTTQSAAQQYNIGAGSKPLAEQLALFANSASTTNMTADQKAAIAQLKGLEGSGKSHGLDIASEKDGVFTLSSGQKIDVSQYEQLIAKLQGIQTSTGATAAALNSPIFSVDRMAPDFNTARVSSWQQTGAMPFNVDHHLGLGPGGVGNAIGNGGTVQIHINNPVIYGNNVDQLAQQIDTALARNRVHNAGNHYLE